MLYSDFVLFDLAELAIDAPETLRSRFLRKPSGEYLKIRQTRAVWNLYDMLAKIDRETGPFAVPMIFKEIEGYENDELDLRFTIVTLRLASDLLTFPSRNTAFI